MRTLVKPLALSALLAAASPTASSTAFAGDYGSAGCGLGSMLIKSDNILQIFAATTNGTFANQTFGITFGTSNCTTGGLLTADKEQEAFAEANLAALQRDMARGQGEYLEAFAVLLACEDEVKDELFSFAQDRYDATFPSEATTSLQALYGFKVQLAQEETFVGACKRI